MKLYLSDYFCKTASSWDTQPNFGTGDMNPGGIGQGKLPSNSNDDGEIIRRWERRKQQRRKRRPQENDQGIVRIFQLGLELPKTQKEEARTLINL